MTREQPNKIYFHFRFQSPLFKKRTHLKAFIESIFKREKKKIEEINFVFCKSQHVLSLNKKYLKHNYNTDILTFNLSESNKPIIADIFISPEQVLKNAKTYNTSFNKEIHRVIFHGVLHLCGYNDKTLKEKQTIRSLEDFYLNEYFA